MKTPIVDPLTGLCTTEQFNGQIYFAVTVSKERAKYLAKCLNEPLCKQCNRELAECDADPCAHSPYSLQGRGSDAADHQIEVDQVMHRSTYVDAVRAAGNLCPLCGSDQIEGYGFDVEHDKASQKVVCLDCPATWYDQYSLDGYQLEMEK